MNDVYRRTCRLGLLPLTMLFLAACQQEAEYRQVSELPVESAASAPTLAHSRPGTLALRTRIRYEDIEALAAEQLPERYPVADSRRVCKDVLGIEVCGTARWSLDIQRPGNLRIRGLDGVIYLQTPISFTGTVGIEGRIARILKLDALNVSGKAQANIAVGLDMGIDWCPTVRADVSYRWLSKPTLVYGGALNFSLERIVNDALDRQLASVETRLNKAIDCALFRNELSQFWKVYSFALELPVKNQEAPEQRLYLNIVPTDFAFSGLRTEDDRLGMSFALGATTVIEHEPQAVLALPLPSLRQVSFAQSKTEFDLIVRAEYEQLEQVINPRLVGREFTADSAAGRVSVTVTSFELSGNASDVTVALGFSSILPGQRRNINGVVYLRASPVIHAEKEELVLENIRLSRVIDSALWNVISRIFEGQIIGSLEKHSVLNLAPKMRELERTLTAQLQDPERTAGLDVTATDMSIRLLDIVAERNTLAARARISTDIDIDIPLTVLRKSEF